MKKALIVLLIALIATPLFATKYDHYGVGFGADFGKANYADSNLVVKNVDLDLVIDSAIYFTEEYSDLQIGLGIQGSIGIPLSVKSNNVKSGDIKIPANVGFTLETAYAIDRDLVVEARLGLGFRYITLSSETIKYGDFKLGDKELRQYDFSVLGGLGGRYFVDDEVSIRFGANFNYTFAEELVFVLTDNKYEYNNSIYDGENNVTRWSARPYVTMAFSY